MAEFYKRNRRVVVKPVPKQNRIQGRPPPSGTTTKRYLFLAGGVLFLIMASFVFAQ